MGIGQSIARLRQKQGLTDIQAAEALGLNIVKYRSLEEEINDFTLDLLVRTADYYQTSIDALLQRNTAEPQPAARAASPDLKDVLQAEPYYDGRKLSALEIQTLEEVVSKLSRHSRKLSALADLIKDDADFVKKLQELKLVSSKLDSDALVSTIEKALA
ncbi:helix-turn-helix domain-containing protein [Paenibacillus sp. y28]|uniref:helix-turn-helix domain-containing protein n=1 Tax=Paenibacillus sp. y28 TaxID=3129110 RepID=UPI003016BA84